MDPSTVELSLSTLLPVGGAGGLLALLWVSLQRGWLITRSQQVELIKAYERTIGVYEKQLEGQDRQIADWRETARAEAARGDILARNQDRMLEGMQTANDLLKALDVTVRGERA